MISTLMREVDMTRDLAVAVSTFAGTGLTRAVVAGFADDGTVIVECQGRPHDLVPCDLLVAAAAQRFDLLPGDPVLAWLPVDTGRGVVLGRLGLARPESEPRALVPTREPGEAVPDELVIEAGSCLTLKVGRGSITIREDGKILIKGSDLVSHAQGTNRIKGGSVAIN